MPGAEKKDVFISYSTRDTDHAQFFCTQLEGGGVGCWIAPRDIPSGEVWAGAIAEAINGADLVVLLVSEGAMASKEVEKEIDLAARYDKRILPVRIQNTDLQRGFAYHLANRQWVDALEEDELTRFGAAIDAVRSILRKTSLSEAVVTGSTEDLTRRLVDSLNNKYRERLLATNSIFTLQKRSNDDFSIQFPVRLGVTGVDLYLRFYKENCYHMEIYADLSVMDDPLKYPFMSFIEANFSDYLPDLKCISSNRRNRFIQLIPATPIDLTTCLVRHPPEKCFELFGENVHAFIEMVFPKLFEWMEYGRFAINGILRLEHKLKELFPENEGWCVGAPETSRLSDLRKDGFICVYKKDWQPSDNHRGRGWFSIVIESNQPFLGNLCIGVLKYYGWLEIGEWNKSIYDACSGQLGQAAQDDRYAWRLDLDLPWRSSGIADVKQSWKDQGIERLADYCLGKFRALKDVAGLLGDACKAMPALPDKEPEEFGADEQKWPGLIILSWMRRIRRAVQDHVTETFGESGIKEVSHQFRGGYWGPASVFVQMKVEAFEAAIKFSCDRRKFSAEIVNMEPPDFERPIVRDFLLKHFLEVPFENANCYILKTIKADKDFAEGSLAEWMNKFQHFILEQINTVVPGMLALKTYLERTVELTEIVERKISSILPSEAGWIIRNYARSLANSEGILVWNSSWPGGNTESRPPLVFQLGASKPCFDDLWYGIKSTIVDATGIERPLGIVCGACEFAFGLEGDPDSGWLWWKSLDDPYRFTTGESFEASLDVEREKAFIGCIGSIFERFRQMDPIIRKACQAKRDRDFEVQYPRFIERLSGALKTHFPEADDWQMSIYAEHNKPSHYISFFKRSWHLPGQERGELGLHMQGGNADFSNIWYGIVKCSPNVVLSNEQAERLRGVLGEHLGVGRNDSWSPFYRYSDDEFRYPRGSSNSIKELVSGQKLENMLKYYSDIFAKLKAAAPIIDEILGVVESKGKSVGGE